MAKETTVVEEAPAEQEQQEKQEDKKTVYEFIIERAEKDPNLSYGERAVLHAIGNMGVDLARGLGLLAANVSRLNASIQASSARTPDAAGQMAIPFPGNTGNEPTV